MSSIPNNFNFFVPAEITKAKDAKGNEIMKIGGIASTTAVDADGEVLDPSGFQLDYLMNSGYLNWHHQSKTDPTAIVGEPTKAEITSDGLYVEGVLYQESKVACGIYELAKTLEKRNSKRRLGFSIEGKVLERDPMDQSKVLSAQITGVAITPTPKNPNTLLNIVKGMYVDDQDTLATSQPKRHADGGSTELLSITLENGDRLIVMNDYTTRVEKATTTESAATLRRESVDGDVKNQEEKLSMKKSLSTFTPLTEQEAYSYIFNRIGLDIEKAHLIYTLTSTNKQMALTKTDLEKAFSLLNIDPTDPSTIQKANDAMNEAMQNYNKKKTSNSEKTEMMNLTNPSKNNAMATERMNVVKADDDDDVDTDDQDDAEKGDHMSKMMKMQKAMDKMMDKDDMSDEDMKKMKSMKKAMDGMYNKMMEKKKKGMMKAMNEDSEMTKMMKAMDKMMAKDDMSDEDMKKMKSMKKAMDGMYKDMMDAVETRIMGSKVNGGMTQNTMVEKALDDVQTFMEDRLDELEKGYAERAAALGVLNKETLSTLGELKKGFDAVVDRLEAIENAPTPRKTLPNSFLERKFQKAQAEGKNVLSKSKHKKQLVNFLDQLAGDPRTEGYNASLGSDCMKFEQSSDLTKSAQDALEKAYDVVIVE